MGWSGAATSTRGIERVVDRHPHHVATLPHGQVHLAVAGPVDDDVSVYLNAVFTQHRFEVVDDRLRLHRAHVGLGVRDEHREGAASHEELVDFVLRPEENGR